MDVTNEDLTEATEADFSIDGAEGEVDFPEDWMVLDDVDEENVEADVNEDVEADKNPSEQVLITGVKTDVKDLKAVGKNEAILLTSVEIDEDNAETKDLTPLSNQPNPDACKNLSTSISAKESATSARPAALSQSQSGNSKQAEKLPTNLSDTENQSSKQPSGKNPGPITSGSRTPRNTKSEKKTAAPASGTSSRNRTHNQSERIAQSKTSRSNSKPQVQSKPSSASVAKLTSADSTKDRANTKTVSLAKKTEDKSQSLNQSSTLAKALVSGKTVKSESKPANQTNVSNQNPQIVAKEKSPMEEKKDGKEEASVDTALSASESQPTSTAGQTNSSADEKADAQGKNKETSSAFSAAKADIKNTTDSKKPTDKKLSGEAVVKLEMLDQQTLSVDASKEKVNQPDKKEKLEIGENTDDKDKKELTTDPKNVESSEKPERGPEKSENTDNKDKKELETDQKNVESSDKSKRGPDATDKSMSASRSTNRSNYRSRNRPSNANDRSRTDRGGDDSSSLRSSKFSVSSRKRARSRSNERHRSRAHSRGRSRDRRSRSRQNDCKSSVDRKSVDQKKSSSSYSSLPGKAVGATDSAKKAKISTAERAVQTDLKAVQNKASESGTVKTVAPEKTSEQLFDKKSSEIEQGLWRFSLRLSPLDVADFAKLDFRNLLKQTQDSVILLKNQGQNKKKKGECHMYFNRLLTTKCTMQKLFQIQLTTRKIEIEINRKVMNSKDKDVATVEFDLTKPGTLAMNTATNVLMARSAGEDKNVHISNVPKNTTQELLFVIFPTAYSIQMPKEGKDKGYAIAQFSSAKCADDIMLCYCSVTINKSKLKFSRKAPSGGQQFDESKWTTTSSTERIKKSLTAAKRRKGSRGNSPSKNSPNVSRSEQPSQVYQIQVLNKRSTSVAKGQSTTPAAKQPDAKRQRIDPMPPAPVPQAFGGFLPPTNIPPPMNMPPGYMVPPMQGGFPGVPPPTHPQIVPQPTWPVTGMAMASNQVQNTTPQNASCWQGAEAISPEWDEDNPKVQTSGNFQGRGFPQSTASGPNRMYHDSRSPSPSHCRISSPLRIRPRSSSPMRTSPIQPRDKSPVKPGRNRRVSNSPRPIRRQSYSPVSTGRMSQSPPRFAVSSKRPGRQYRSNFSPISQGRLSRSPGRRSPLPGRKGHSPGRRSPLPGRKGRSPGRRSPLPGRKGHSPRRQNQPRKRRSQSPRQMSHGSYSPISQGRLSRSPERRGVSPQRDYLKRRGRISPVNRRGSPERDRRVNKPASRSGHRDQSPGRERGLGRSEHSQSLGRSNYHQDRLNRSLSPKARISTNIDSRGSLRGSYDSGRQRLSPGKTGLQMGYSQTSERQKNEEQLSPVRQVEKVSSYGSERATRISVDKEGWTGFTSLYSSAPPASKKGLFPAAFSSETTTPPEANKIDIPGLEQLLAATAGKTDTRSERSSGSIAGDSQKEYSLKQELLQMLVKKEQYQPRELHPESSDGRNRLQERDLPIGSREKASSWWREDSPKSSSPFSRERSPRSTAGNMQGDVQIKRKLDMMMNRSQEAAKRMASSAFSSSASGSQGVGSGREQDRPTGGSMGTLGLDRLRDILSSLKQQPPKLSKDIPFEERDTPLSHAMGQERSDQGEVKRPLKSALRKPTPASKWAGGSSDIDFPGIDQPEMNRGASDHLGMSSSGFDGQDFNRPDSDRPGLNRPPWQDNQTRGPDTWIAGNARVQGWSNSAGSQSTGSSSLGGSMSQSRPTGTAPDQRMLVEGGNMAWNLNAQPGAGAGLGSGGGNRYEPRPWQGPPQEIRPMGNPQFGESGSWLPPPGPVGQNRMLPGNQPFIPRPPF